MPDFLTLSMCFYRVCERRNLPLKAHKSQIWASGNAGVKLAKLSPALCLLLNKILKVNNLAFIESTAWIADQVVRIIRSFSIAEIQISE